LTGLGLGLAITSTGTLRQGYPGAGMNPSRCFGLAVPVAAFSCERTMLFVRTADPYLLAILFTSATWIHWSATFVVSAVIGLLYHLVRSGTSGRVLFIMLNLLYRHLPGLEMPNIEHLKHLKDL
jgi:hypothetical protein